MKFSIEIEPHEIAEFLQSLAEADKTATHTGPNSKVNTKENVVAIKEPANVSDQA